jgi:outer membrane protein OmpA-like peptidoglycan-associated protein
MAQDWLSDVRKYASDADEKVVGAIVRYCGIALQSVDSSLVSFTDVKETDRVRQNYLKKKLGLTHDDATLDAGIAAIGERMKADRTKNRVTVYYLLAEHFSGLGVFGGAAVGASGGTTIGGGSALAGGAAGLAALTPSAAKASSHSGGGSRDDDGYFAWGCGFGLLLLGGIILAALLAWWADRPHAAPAAAPAPVVAAAPAPTVPAPQAVPEGAGVIAGEREAKPMLTVYFDTGKADVTPDFAAAAAPVLAYLQDNPGAMLAISGFNDPTGNAAANAELSKNRAQNVKAALEALGVEAERAALEKPAETTDSSATSTEARRVEVVVKE